ncbi:CAP domain-containing protein [Burkholderia pseudomallei]|uniref:CAP domain-containing protein n=1 Tax=Burkholderia pseudomallei TaxID=28450 RepID=UPI000F07D784|nr:CAP domain-containing protein [Burkholderia pseudomallei]CAJ3070631.1 Allergen V5/Tpx-1 family protein [Burkholderia pseudomallei]VCK72966.1 Allergen V5/Tpx-1 family protein [Burkholderia pseudomallei]VCK79919.1 Allergen V5/Tpx-1 family protein [Burkholderia pseudomallei]VCK80102.1 Allergen V5/Tpx-1 family protein [Burkholderia pseudomallei]VCK80855.1 Allergen V5/Tpx-1 family protein [Burkholderia pseudomallei]
MKHTRIHAPSRSLALAQTRGDRTALAPSPTRSRGPAFSSLRIAGCAIAAAALLAACGGGGGSSGSGGSSSGTSSSGSPATSANAQVALVAAPGAAAASFTPTGDVINDSLGFINYQRAQVGLSALAFQSGVAQAATNHSVWEQDNNLIGHIEASNQQGYTAASPLDRVNLYYKTTSVGEVTAGMSGPFTSSTEAIQELFDAPFHRAIILFDAVYAGVGDALATSPSQLSTLTVDFADYKQVVQDNQLIAWPYNGQTNVNTSWLANESPNPMAAAPQYEGQVVGYPVTLSGSDNAAFSNVTFTITNPAGVQVPCQEVDSSNNADATREAMCVPFQPLDTSTTYTVKATGTLTNTSLPATPFTLSWQFTTLATANEAKAARQLQQQTPARTVILN